MFPRRTLLVLACLRLAAPAARAEEEPAFILTLRNHRFEPERLEVPAHTRIRLLVRNTDPAAEEFESTKMRRERVIPAGHEATIHVGPLPPGEYDYFGDFHADTARGVLVAR